MKVDTKQLYRPVGLKELELIHQSGMRAFPPRLPEQPIFYPVLNREYARQIARDRNTKDANSGHSGFVLSFSVNAEYLSRFVTQIVGGSEHAELWIPAEELAEFNRHIEGKLEVLDAFQGEAFEMALNPHTLLPSAWKESA